MALRDALPSVLVLLTLIGCARGHVADDAGPTDRPDAQRPDAGPACAAASCHPLASCDDSSGLAVCTCPIGYAGDGRSCADLDECGSGTAGCDVNATCTNTEGGFTCTCAPGFVGDGTVCTDVDECAAAGCDANATCMNMAGSFTCVCNAGYDGDGLTCADLDECAAGTAGCHALATCSNTPGSFTCACLTGYMGDGTSCADIDECAAGTAGCHPSATCTNTAGSFSCSCNAGFTGDGFACTDVDECATGTDDCHPNATCTNTSGSFGCACNTGYTGDGRTCTPIGPACTVIDGFETGSWPYSPWVVRTPGGVITTSIRHDGLRALQDPDWHYRTSTFVGSVGDRLDAWVNTAGGTGRIYLGFGASASGTKSFVIGPNTDELMFQDNASWSYSEVASTPQVYATGTWYRIEVEFRAGNQVIGNLYSASGALVRSVLHTFPTATSGGIAIRGFNGLVVDTIRLCR